LTFLTGNWGGITAKVIGKSVFEHLTERGLVTEENYRRMLVPCKRYPLTEQSKTLLKGCRASIKSLLDDNNLPTSMYPLLLLKVGVGVVVVCFSITTGLTSDTIS
jgi:hypothetical protein